MSDFPIRSGSDEGWDDLMRQLRTHPQARPRPFFYGRVRARLARQAAVSPPLLSAWRRRLLYAAQLGALVLSLSLSGDCSAATAHPDRPPAQVFRRGAAQVGGSGFCPAASTAHPRGGVPLKSYHIFVVHVSFSRCYLLVG